MMKMRNFMVNGAVVFIALTIVCFMLALPAYSLELNPKASFNLGWKFIASNPAGAKTTTFNDAAWQSVSIPHSASYDAPYYSSEQYHFRSTCWYRKTFTCPATAKKVFMHFEGAMQTCDVFINGDSIGSHYFSGYTPFNYDISNHLVKGGNNVVALRLNNVNSTSIPPGGLGTDGQPDFFLFSGLYRNVWLQFKDSVYIPTWGQRITTPGSTTSAGVRARTVVNNASASAASAAVTITLFDGNKASVVTTSSTQSVPAASSKEFDMTTSYIIPQLWSPTAPNMYSLQTIVKVNGTVVDSMVQPVGFRWFSWTAANGFSLNGTRLELYGFCVHQNMGWIEIAVPDSRFFQQIKKMKAMGINSVRCSHYPRNQAFYDACDKLGMLVYVELPTWMVAQPSTLPAGYWPNLDSCVAPMVLDGFNHPSIYAWGIANEPNYSGVYDTYWNTIVNMIHGIDSVSLSGRVTSYAKNMGTSVTYTGVDVVGINYQTSNSAGKPYFNTEAYGNSMSVTGCTAGNWYRQYYRGYAMDTSVAAGSEAANEICNMSFVTGKTSGAVGGGHFWCFQDYASWRNTVGGEGVVDRLWVPKMSYYLFRKTWTGVAPDYPKNTGAATKIDLVADTTNLKADGTDVAILIANLRNAGDTCIRQACNITWTVTGPATLFPGTGFTGNLTTVTDSALGGRASVLLKTSTTPGLITVIATSSCGLTPDTIQLNSSPVTENYYLGSVDVAGHSPFRQLGKDAPRLQISASAKGYSFHCYSAHESCLSIVNLQGRAVFSTRVQKGSSVILNKLKLGNGIYYGVLEDGNQKVTSLINNVKAQ